MAPGAPIQLMVFPREEGPGQFLYNRFTGREREDNDLGVSALARAVELVAPLLQRIDAVLGTSGLLTMPPIGEPR